MAHSRGRRQGRADRLPAGTVPLAVLLPRRERRPVRSGRADSRPDHARRFARLARELQRRDRRLAVRAPRRRPLSQHRGGHRRRRRARSASTARCTSPTIRSTSKSSTSRRAISASAASTRASAASARWSAGTSGIRKRARLAALGGAHVLFYPTAIGWHPAEKAQYGAAQHDAWRTIQRAHAIANGVYVAAVNRVGFEGPPEHGLEFWGGIVRRRSVRPGARRRRRTTDEEILVVECDPRAHRRSAPQLAVPARPPHRRLRAHPEPGDRLMAATPRSLRLPHAGRVGAARGHLDRLAAQSRRLAGQVRADSLGLRRDRAQARRAWRGCAFWCEDARRGAARAAFCAKCGADLEAVEFFRCPTDRSLDARLLPDLRQESRAAKSRITDWRFNGWAKYDNWQHDDASPARSSRSG